MDVDDAEPHLVEALELCRLAPSAANRQPWRFTVRRDMVVLALTREQPIDAGIVMAHYALAAQAFGLGGGWQLRWGDSELAEACGLPQSATVVAVFA